MQAEITVLTRRGSAVMRRSHRASGDNIRFGRGTGNEVPLPDIRVPLLAAGLYRRPGGLFIEQLGDVRLQINGQATTGVAVEPGDEILIGPYRVVLTDPSTEVDVALTVELVQAIDDALHQVLQQTRVGLELTHLSKRRASWVLFLALIGLGLAVPIAAYMVGPRLTSPTSVVSIGRAPRWLQALWQPGDMSNAHRYFAEQCGTCHQAPFSAVPDSACLVCHRGIGNHIPTLAADALSTVRAGLDRRRCADCHVEHRGLNSLVVKQASLCLDCHRSMAETAPAAGVPDVRGFPNGHPQFRATIVSDPLLPSFTRIPLDSMSKAVDHADLIFSHAAHLRTEGFPALHIKPMVCSQCHVPEPSGQGFLPITYKGQCQSCHRLKFAIDLPWAEVPHGDDKAVASAVEGFYAAFVIKHGVPAAPPQREIARRLPGTTPTQPAKRPTTQAWVAQETDAALAIVFKSKTGCFYCHVVDSRRGPYRVAPVRMLTRFFPSARFNHAKHLGLACEDCHAARKSEASADVMIPGLQRCTTCHGTESASFKAESTCVSCHLFHRKEFGQMRETAAIHN